MDELVKINSVEISIKEYMGQRVVTFREIDQVHGRLEGTARKRFNENRKHFVEGTDFFILRRGDNALSEKRTVEVPPMGITLITETGYLMLVKSFTDELAWKVQRELVRNYFSKPPVVKTVIAPTAHISVEENLKKISRRSIAIEVLGEMYEQLRSLEYRKPLAEAMRIVSFDICSCVFDIQHAEN